MQILHLGGDVYKMKLASLLVVWSHLITWSCAGVINSEATEEKAFAGYFYEKPASHFGLLEDNQVYSEAPAAFIAEATSEPAAFQEYYQEAATPVAPISGLDTSRKQQINNEATAGVEQETNSISTELPTLSYEDQQVKDEQNTELSETYNGDSNSQNTYEENAHTNPISTIPEGNVVNYSAPEEHSEAIRIVAEELQTHAEDHSAEDHSVEDDSSSVSMVDGPLYVQLNSNAPSEVAATSNTDAYFVANSQEQLISSTPQVASSYDTQTSTADTSATNAEASYEGVYTQHPVSALPFVEYGNIFEATKQNSDTGKDFQGYLYDKPVRPFPLDDIDNTFDHQELGSQQKPHRHGAIESLKLRGPHRGNALSGPCGPQGVDLHALLAERSRKRPQDRRLVPYTEVYINDEYFY